MDFYVSGTMKMIFNYVLYGTIITISGAYGKYMYIYLLELTYTKYFHLSIYACNSNIYNFNIYFFY